MSSLSGIGLGALLAVSCCMSSCCSIVNGRTQSVAFKSTPGARLYIDGQDRGNTPQEVYLERRKTYEIRLVAPGYEPYRTTLKGSISGWMLGNVLLGGFIGLGIDLATGAVYAFDDVDARLMPQGAPVRVTQGNLPSCAVKIGWMKPIHS